MPHKATERTCISLKSSQLAILKRRSRQTGAPVAELVRRAVDAYLAADVVGDRPRTDSGRAHPDSPDRLLDAGHEMERDRVEVVGRLLRILGFPDVDQEMEHGSRRSPRRHSEPVEVNPL